MKCPRCGFQNPDDAFYCIGCGHALTPNPSPERREEPEKEQGNERDGDPTRGTTGRECPRCGFRNPDDASFCIGCGFPLGAAPSGVLQPEPGARQGGIGGPVSRGPSKAGLVFRAVGAVLLFVVLLFVCQSCVVTGYMSSAMMQLGVGEAAASGNMDFMTEEFVSKLTEMTAANSVTILLIANLLTLLVICLLFRLRRRKPTEEFALHPVNPYRLPAFALFGTAVNIASSGIISLLPLPESTLQSFETQYASLFGSNILLEILTAAIVTPIVEEVVFRGIAMTRLTPALGTAGAVAVSAVIFAIAHMTPIAVGYTLVVGVLLALIFARTRTILPTIVFHMFFNLTPYWIGNVGEGLFIALFIVSLLLTARLVWSQIVRYPRFTDLLYDTSGRIAPEDDADRAVIGEVKRLREGADFPLEKLQRLSDEWDENQIRKYYAKTARRIARLDEKSPAAARAASFFIRLKLRLGQFFGYTRARSGKPDGGKPDIEKPDGGKQDGGKPDDR